MPTGEEEDNDNFLRRAAAADGGKGLSLAEYDPDDPDEMKLIYEALKEDDPHAQRRLKALIRTKRQQQAYVAAEYTNVTAGALANAKAPGDSLSQLRGPIVLAQYGRGSGIDTNKDDLQLKNATLKPLGSLDDPNIKTAEHVLEKMKELLLPAAEKLLFLDQEDSSDSFVDWNLYEKCLTTSSNWLDDDEDSAKRVFQAGKNEQLQMHLGGSNLVLYPLLFASDASNKLNKHQEAENPFKPVRGGQKVDAQLLADAEWDSQEVLTHTKFGERVRAKFKADAWLRLEITHSGGIFRAPIFHFEHNASNQGRAHRKAVLLSQLTWRRIFLACTKGYSGEYRDTLKEANEKCKDLPIWFASLEGTTFRIGALKGHYEYGCKEPWVHQDETRKIVSYAKFEYCATWPIDVTEQGKTALSFMYAVSRHLPHHIQKVISLLPAAITDTEMDQGQDYSKAGSQALLGSKRGNPNKSDAGGGDAAKRRKGSGDRSKGSGDTKQRVSGYAKKECVIELLNNEVTNVKHLWAIPNDALFEKIVAFDGDHIFSGTWNGEKTVIASGTRVVIKAFSGDEELDEYENEVAVLEAIASVSYVQKLVTARKADRFDFAIIVSPMQPTTSSDIRSLEDIRELGRQILRALVELRHLGIIHRDIKPSNILWLPVERRATLIDFGLATRATMERVSPKAADNFPYILSSSGIVGTEGYQAPEVLADCTYDENIDVYSLGKTLQNIAAAASIENTTSLDDVIGVMTREDPSKRCTALEVLGMAFFA